MADLSITAANVAYVSNQSIRNGIAGATVTAGQAVYLDETVNKYKLADNDNSSTTATVAGIALNGASDGQPLAVMSGGLIAIGGTVTVGEIYVLSSTAGGICPEADLGTSDYVSIIGVGTTAARIQLGIINSGAQVPA